MQSHGYKRSYLSPAYRIHYTEKNGNKNLRHKNLRTSVSWIKPVQVPRKEPMSLRKSGPDRPQANSCRAGSQRPAQIDPGPVRRQQGKQVVFAYPLRTGRRCDGILQGYHVMRNQNISVSKAKKAISDYRNATGDLQGIPN